MYIYRLSLLPMLMLPFSFRFEEKRVAIKDFCYANREFESLGISKRRKAV
jgi:hypothetical protein